MWPDCLVSLGVSEHAGVSCTGPVSVAGGGCHVLHHHHSHVAAARLAGGVQGEMQEALKAIDMGVAAASTEFKAAAKAGKKVVTMSVTVLSNGGGDAAQKGTARSLSGKSSSSKAIGSSAVAGAKEEVAKGSSGSDVVAGNLLLAKSPLMQRLAQRALENEQAALAEGRMTNRNGLKYGFVPNAIVEEEAHASGNVVQEDDPKVKVELTGSDVAEEESQFSEVAGAFVAAAQQQKAEIGKRAFRTHQNVRKLALLLGEPSESEASTLFSSVVSLADSFDGAFAKIAGSSR